MSDPTSNSLSLPINSNDKRPLPEIIASHYGFPLAYVDDVDGVRYYAVQKKKTHPTVRIIRTVALLDSDVFTVNKPLTEARSVFHKK